MSDLSSKGSDSTVARWTHKFGCAFRGLAVGCAGQSSFYVHVPAALAVVALGVWLAITAVQWSLLVVCISMVIAAELFNSALESLAQAITRESHPQVRDALDVASGAVLAISIGAAIVGCIILVWPLAELLLSS